MRFGWLSRLHQRLGVRLVLWYTLFFAGTAVAVAMVSYHYLSSSLRDNRHVIQAKLNELNGLAERGEIEAIEKSARLAREIPRKKALLVRLLNSQQQVLLFSQPQLWGEFDFESVDRRGPLAGWQYVGSKRDGDVLELISVRYKNGLWLQVGKTIEDRKEILAHYRDTIIGVISGMTLLGLAGGAFLAFRALQPIRNVTEAMQAIVATGRMDARVPESGVGDDLDELTRLFNRMLARVEALITNMREALDNVAHDLRTPLARIRGAAEVALQVESNHEQRCDALASNIEESDRLLALLNALMDVSEAESGSLRLQLEKVLLREVVDEVVELYEYSAEDAQVRVLVNSSSDIAVAADRTRLRQVLANLLDNAIKYSSPGSKVTIDLQQAGDRAVVSFTDEGAGIAREEIAKVWDRLYRSDKSRSQPGLGVGLSLVRAVVHAHKGEVEVQSTLGKGSVFTISFPLDHVG
jgi:signal transduction histidine kinase